VAHGRRPDRRKRDHLGSFEKIRFSRTDRGDWRGDADGLQDDGEPGAAVSVADGDEDRELLMSRRTSVIDPQFL
jgi:hypothetical protein